MQVALLEQSRRRLRRPLLVGCDEPVNGDAECGRRSARRGTGAQHEADLAVEHTWLATGEGGAGGARGAVNGGARKGGVSSRVTARGRTRPARRPPGSPRCAIGRRGFQREGQGGDAEKQGLPLLRTLLGREQPQRRRGHTPRRWRCGPRELPPLPQPRYASVRGQAVRLHERRRVHKRPRRQRGCGRAGRGWTMRQESAGPSPEHLAHETSAGKGLPFAAFPSLHPEVHH